MKYFVTGATGFIGKRLVKTLLARRGAVVYFLRKVIWTVPDFDVDRYRDRLRALHDRIQSDGAFVSTAPRFLIELVKRDH